MMPDRTTSALPWRLAAIVAVGLGVVPAALGQFKPPFHVPIHEYTQLFVLIGAFVQLNLSAVLVQRTQEGPDRAASVLWLALAAVGLRGFRPSAFTPWRTRGFTTAIRRGPPAISGSSGCRSAR